MNTSTARWFLLAAIAGAASFALQAAAPDPDTGRVAPSIATPSPTPPQTLPQTSLQAPENVERTDNASDAAGNLEIERDESDSRREQRDARRKSWDHVIVQFGRDAMLAAGDSAVGVVAVVGSATSDGDVWEGVISVLGNTRVRGSANSAVAIFGDTYVNGKVHDAVAVFGNVELGPHAEVSGQATAVGGIVKRDPRAIIHGGVDEISFPEQFGNLDWLQPWLKHCLLYGRPLALEPGIAWAWSLALGFLGLYVLIALLFSGSVEKCVATLEERPSHSLLAAVLTMLLTPVAMVLLAITVIGIAIIPALWIALFCAGIFGKVVILAALGRRMTRFISAGPLSHVAFPVLLGGLMLIGIYLVPVLGLIAYKVTNIIGLGVVVYTMMLAAKAHQESQVPLLATPAHEPVNPPMSAALEMPAEGPSAATGAPLAATDAGRLPRAGFWIRMAALLVDVILVAIAVTSLKVDDAWLLFLAAYGAVMWKLRGTTVGGILCNLQVVRVDGRELDWPTCVVRALSCFLSLIAGGLGFLWIVFDIDRQAWHDKIAGTAVVRVPPGRSLV